MCESNSRCPGLLATVACASYRRLDASVGASGPHDFAVRAPPFEKATRQTWYRSAEALAKADQRRSSCAAAASTASRPNVRDDGQRPSGWGRDGGNVPKFPIFGKRFFGVRTGYPNQLELPQQIDFCAHAIWRALLP